MKKDKDNYTATISVKQSPDEVFAAVNNVRGWWSQEIDGRTDALGEVFKFRYKDLHRTTHKITEFVLGNAGGVIAARSVDVGCVRMTERHLRSDPPTAAEIAAAEQDITKAVDAALRTVSGHGTATLVGLAGSVTTVAALALHLPRYDTERIHHAQGLCRRGRRRGMCPSRGSLAGR